jgi:hypothetical protein
MFSSIACPAFSRSTETHVTTANTLTKTMPLHAPAPPRVLTGLGKLYCRMFHRDISRPFHGRYVCWKCLREFDAGWGGRR